MSHVHEPGVPRREQFTGCLLGMAVGDAVGAPFEGLLDDIIYRLGPADAIVARVPEEVLTGQRGQAERAP